MDSGAAGPRFASPSSVRWTWVDRVYCLFVLPVLGFTLACFLLYLSTGSSNFWIILGWPAVAIGLPILAGRLFRRWRRTREPSGRTPLWQWPLWSLPPLLLLGWFGAEAADPHRGSWLVRHLLLDSFALELDVSLTFDGEPVTIRRRIDCIEWWDVDHISGAGISRRFPVYPTVQSVGQRLASGGAVMVLVPYDEDVCLKLADWADQLLSARLGTIAYPLPTDFLPLIAWTPTPDDPEMIEAYVTRSYYARPGARLQVRELALRFAKPGSAAPQEKEEEFAWFFPSPEVYPPEDYGRVSYFGLYAAPAAETEWSQDGSVAHLLRSIEQPTIADWGSLRRALDKSSHIPRLFKFWSGLGDVVLGEFLRPQIYLGYPGSDVGYLEDFIPLRREDGAYVLAPHARGLVVLYRQPAWAQTGGDPLRMRLEDSLLAIEEPYGSRGPALRYAHLFDPRDARLYALGPVYIHSLSLMPRKPDA